MLTLFAGIIMLGVLVFVHEFGHFIVAKMAGVKILRFSLGFGPKLLSRQWGETEYMICAIPLGGYVQMLGEGDPKEGEAPLTEAERARAFSEKPVMVRTAIIAAGPAMNLLLPFFVLPLAFLVGVNLPAYIDEPPCVGYVLEESVGLQSGFAPGDCIVAVNGLSAASWDETNRTLVSVAGQPVEFTVERDGESRPVSLPAGENGIEGLQSIGLFPRQDAVIGGLAPGMPAIEAGLEVGDRIIGIDDKAVTSWYDLKHMVQESEGGSSTFTVQRADETLTLNIKPIRRDDNGPDYLIGVTPQQETVFRRFGPMEAFAAGGERSMELIQLTLLFVQKLFAGHVSSDSIGGPITVVQIAGQAAQTDLASILSVLAFLSIQLGILNLFPIPILDGGHLFFNLFEIILRRPLSIRTREVAQQIGLVMILGLMILAFYNDIVRIFLGGE